MRTSLYLCVAALGALLAVGAVGRENGPGSFMLEVPARDLSVGQQFQPRLLDTSNGAAVPETVSVTLLDASGRQLASQELEFTGGAITGAPWSLPRPGTYRVRASSPSGTQTAALEALPEPPRDFGGVAAITSWGVPGGAVEYLRQHGFAVTAVEDAGSLPSNPVIVIGDPRLPVPDLAAAYTGLWHAVEGGARLLLLEPPPPGVQPFWPLNAPLRPAPSACPDDGPGTWDLAPEWSYDLSAKGVLDIYHWDGTYMPRAQGAGYTGCHALFSYRYGQGWVTVSTRPLLQHFQDVRARADLMALVKAQLRRKHAQPASPGLAWVMRQRLEALAKAPPAPLEASSAVRYLPPPAPVAPASVLVPLSATASPPVCWTSPQSQAVGAAARLSLSLPQAVQTLDLNFGPDAAFWPAHFQLEASSDGRHWTPLATPAIAAGGGVSVPVAAPPPPAAGWRDFQLTLTTARPHAWRLCQFRAR